MKLGWTTIAESWRRLRRFFQRTVWEARLEDLPGGRAFGYRMARIAHSSWRGFRQHRLTSRAAALTYFTLLSLVPFLAFAFALLKGFGAYSRFIEGTIRPYLQDTFGANPPLLSAMEKVLEFVEQTDVARLGTVGVLVLAYGAISLLANVESALNAIWDARSRRPLLRQVTDYTTLIVTTPLLMLVATTFATAAQSSGIVTYMRNTWALGAVIDFLLGLTSLVVTIIAMIALYAILPNVKIRASSAVLGGIFSGLLWQAALLLHVNFQAGVARYNALYSGFVALPIFLVWTYLSWSIVLLGALIAASHQNERAARQRFRAEFVDQALEEVLALAVAAQITRTFLAGGPRPTAADLAEHFEISPIVVEDVLEALCRANIVVRVTSAGQFGYVPGGDVDQLRASDVLSGVRRRPEADPLRRVVAEKVDQRLFAMTDGAEGRLRGDADDLTLRELAPLLRSPPAAGRAPASGQRREASVDASEPSVLDAKQPDLPG